jgi:hypothetical protein
MSDWRKDWENLRAGEVIEFENWHSQQWGQHIVSKVSPDEELVYLDRPHAAVFGVPTVNGVSLMSERYSLPFNHGRRFRVVGDSYYPVGGMDCR